MQSQRRFVIGDIHGAHKALLQCFERSGFDLENDFLICLGDICDRWPGVAKVFDTMLSVKNLVLLLGNHDQWALEWFNTGRAPQIWLGQGGNFTRDAYPDGVPENHMNLLNRAVLFHEMENKLFVHAGYDPEKDIEEQDRDILLWDRSFIRSALYHEREGEEFHITPYDEVYIGHTPTINFGQTKPMKCCEVYLMDTGAGWPGGRLSMMDIDNKQLFQSDMVDQLYPGN